ncbi:MAG: UDP-glucose 4-epimerase GalE [Clostridia bacterium]|nr:UDP-glucose 4-epimerase GalE [Clostridia bacterium]MDR3643604.1 UDP-glucose 4-epimerase GalE [Clostridia bacterium]
MSVLVTGGAGYIGSHTCLELLEAGREIVVLDNLCNSSSESLNRVEKLTGRPIRFYHGDMLDAGLLKKIFTENPIDAVIHFAGLKAVGESVQIPLRYYHNNITGTLTLLEAMKENGVRRFIFSSSATVYGAPEIVPIREEFPLSAANPYGRTKLIIEDILRDVSVSDPSWSVVLLRYFNPVGAHKSGMIGEAPNGVPNNLMPYITQVAVGKLKELNVYGDDYPTADGTGVRDYIHVVDLAKGHLTALKKAESFTGVEAYNLGTGRGYSVLEFAHAFEAANGVKIPYRIAPRRAGDIAACYADPSKALRELGWKAEKGIHEMCEDSWRWQKNNPKGYE